MLRSPPPPFTPRQASASRFKELELEDYAQLFYKYSVIIEEQSSAVRHLQNEVTEAYAVVAEEHNNMVKEIQPRELSIEELLNTLKYYGDLCEVPPQSVLELS